MGVCQHRVLCLLMAWDFHPRMYQLFTKNREQWKTNNTDRLPLSARTHRVIATVPVTLPFILPLLP